MLKMKESCVVLVGFEYCSHWKKKREKEREKVGIRSNGKKILQIFEKLIFQN